MIHSQQKRDSINEMFSFHCLSIFGPETSQNEKRSHLKHHILKKKVPPPTFLCCHFVCILLNDFHVEFEQENMFY